MNDHRKRTGGGPHGATGDFCKRCQERWPCEVTQLRDACQMAIAWFEHKQEAKPYATLKQLRAAVERAKRTQNTALYSSTAVSLLRREHAALVRAVKRLKRYKQDLGEDLEPYKHGGWVRYEDVLTLLAGRKKKPCGYQNGSRLSL